MRCYPSHWRTPSCFKMGTLHHQPGMIYYDIGWVILCFWDTTWFFNVREIFYLVLKWSKVGCSKGAGSQWSQWSQKLLSTSGAVPTGFQQSGLGLLRHIEAYGDLQQMSVNVFKCDVLAASRLRQSMTWPRPHRHSSPRLKGDFDGFEMLEIIWRFLASDLVPMGTPKLWVSIY